MTQEQKAELEQLRAKLRASEGKPGLADRVAAIKARIEELEANS